MTIPPAWCRKQDAHDSEALATRSQRFTRHGTRRLYERPVQNHCQAVSDTSPVPQVVCSDGTSWSDARLGADVIKPRGGWSLVLAMGLGGRVFRLYCGMGRRRGPKVVHGPKTAFHEVTGVEEEMMGMLFCCYGSVCLVLRWVDG